MKKFVCTMLTILMAFSLVTMPAFAAEVNETETVVANNEYEVQPRGAISGNGQTTIGSGVTSGSFTFSVTGIMNWSTAQVRLYITGFNADDYIDAKVYRPDGTECFHIAGWLGDVLSPSGNTDTGWLTFSDGQRGTYRVVYSVGNWYGSTTGSGTLYCGIK